MPKSSFSPIAPRYFNHLTYTEHTVIKGSSDISKIKSEYLYYQLLPNILKPYMVEPYDYSESGGLASYTMTKVLSPTVASLWITNQLTAPVLRDILDQLFTYLHRRPQQEITASAYLANADNLYLHKLDRRIDELKHLPVYPELARDISTISNYDSLDDIVGLYHALYLSRPQPTNHSQVISHGDLCFSNIFYDATTHTVRFIDPRGAFQASDLYLDPYYDIAKLSHSIHGGYDFFNAGLYQTDPHHLITAPDFTWAVDIFNEYLADNQYDPYLVHLYEASLLLSMLPLHIDSPRKVLAFILNAAKILQELAHER